MGSELVYSYDAITNAVAPPPPPPPPADAAIADAEIDAAEIDAAEIELGHSHGRLRTTLAHRQELLAAAEDDH